MKKTPKVLALVFSLVMVFSCIPYSAFAQENTTASETDTQELTQAVTQAVTEGNEETVTDLLSDFISGDQDNDYGETQNATSAYTIESAESSSGDSIDFIQMSDIHVFSEILIENASKDYNDDVVKYNKVLGETFPILNAAFTAIENDVRDRGLRYVLISGDLTANGEYNNHVMLATFLRSFQTQMREKYDPEFHIFVINGNHDLNNFDSSYYDEDGNVINSSDSLAAAQAQITNSAQFADIYYDLGYGEDDDDCNLNVTYYKDTLNLNKREKHDFEDSYANLSYAADLTTRDGDKIKLIVYDSNEYSADSPDAETVTVDGVEMQGQYTGCTMSEDHLNWIKEQCADAEANGEMVLGMSHYAVVPHFTIQGAVLKMFIYPDWENLSRELANAGMHYTLSGHMHCNDIGSYTSEEGETIYDIETGALSGSFPNCFREISFTQNDDGTIDCSTAINNCDRDVQVDLSKCYYTYDDSGNPDYSLTMADVNAINEDFIKLHTIDGVKYTEDKNICDLSKTDVDSLGNPYSKISKPFSANYGIYSFMGGKIHATETGDVAPGEVVIDANGNSSIVYGPPSIKQMGVNMVSGYINGRTYKKILNEGGLRGLLESLLGQDLDSFLESFLPEEVTFSVITLQRSDIIALANELIDKINAAYIEDNTTIRTVAETLITNLLDYEISGYSLSEIATQCLVGHYRGNEAGINAGTDTTIKAGTDEQIKAGEATYKLVDMDKVFEEINNDNETVHGLIDYLIDILLYGTDLNGDPIELTLNNESVGESKGLIFDLLGGITINVDEVYKVLPDFAGVLQYPTIRQLVLGTDKKEIPVVTVVDKWAGKIVKGTYNFTQFSTGKTSEKSVTNTATLIEYYVFNMVDDYLDEEQLTSVSDLLVSAIASFTEDPCFDGSTHGDYVVNPYDLRAAGLVTGNDIQNTIDYAPLSKTTATKENYMLPNTLSVTFGSDTTSSKKFNWYTKNFVTGSDVQIIPYKANASAADFTSSALVDCTVTKDEADGLQSLVYPTLDIGVYSCSEAKTMYRHAVTVTGLVAGTKYTYRVGDASKGYWSDPAVLETAAGDDSAFTFVQMSDNQSQTEEQYKISVGSVLEAVKNNAADAKFIMQTGDIVDYGANMRQWSWALAGMEDYSIVSVSGNHEPKGNSDGNLLNAPFTAAQDTFYNIDTGSADSEQDKTTGVYYDYDYNDVHFMVINTNDLNDENGLSDEQVEWLKESCANTDKTWKVLAMHKSLYSNASHFDDSDVEGLRAQLSKLFPELGIDVVFSGHDHVLISTDAISDGAIATEFDSNNVIENANGTVYTVAGKAGIKYYKVKDKSAVDEAFGFDKYYTTLTEKGSVNYEYSYSKVTVDGDSLTVEVYNAKDDGASELVRSYTLKKSKLSAPTGVTAKSQSLSAIKVSWIESQSAGAYEVYRSESESGTYTKIGTTSSLSYTDTSVEAGKIYYYKIVAGTSENASSNMKSSFSEIASAVAGPMQVTGLKVTQKTDTSAQLTWSKVKDADSYNVYYSTSKNGTYKLAVTSDTINAVVDELSSGTYYVKVAAVQDGIEGEPSTAKEVTIS